VEPLVPGWPGWEPVQQVAEPPLFACPPPEDLAVDPAPGPAPTTVARFERAAEREWDLAALLARPVTPQARPYRDLAANILSQLEPGEASAILFAAVSGHSHTTATVARLGAVMGPIAEGQILAVDVDLRSPALAGRFAVQADRGVADVLLGSASWEDVVRPSGVEGLALLPGRRQPAADFLAVEPMRRAWLLDELRRRYRLVLLDAGRLPTADASPWARFCEGAYLVVGLGQATAGATRRAAAEIDRRGGRLLGSVLTTPPRAEGRR